VVECLHSQPKALGLSPGRVTFFPCY